MYKRGQAFSAEQVEITNKAEADFQAQLEIELAEEKQDVEVYDEQNTEILVSKAKVLWESGDKIGALETILGHYVNSTEFSENPILSTYMLSPTAEQAVGAALMIRLVEQTSH